MTRRTPSKRIILAILAVVAVVLLAAGCGGSDSSSGASSATTSTTASSSSFSDCLKSNGVDNFDPSQFGSGGAPPDNVDPATLQKAMQACQSLAPQGAPGGAPQGGQSSGRFQKFQQCMKDNGVDSFGPGTQGSQSQADQAKMKKARKACASLAPQGGFPQGGLPQGAPGGGGGNFTAFSRCMKRNGAPLPGAGSTATVDTTSATYLEAQRKCQPLLTGGPSQ
jgi:hypothetical protein